MVPTHPDGLAAWLANENSGQLVEIGGDGGWPAVGPPSQEPQPSLEWVCEIYICYWGASHHQPQEQAAAEVV